MSTQQESATPHASSKSDFGTNDWVIEDMYQRYLESPDQVDPAWHEFFADYKPSASGSDGPAVKPAANGGAPAAPSSASAPSAPAKAAPVDVPAPTPQEKPAEVDEPKPADNTAQDGKVDSLTNAATARKIAETAKAEAKAPEKKAEKKAAAAPASSDSEYQQLRGAAGAIVKNMEKSLEIPSATSVRAVPAKLLADNRIVINNHLGRSRGGKVSFTHLIGYALVKALADFPEMNHSFAEVDGKPTLVKPAHVNLGLAIDLQKPDGTRTLVVASIKNCEQMDFAQFLAAYEDIVRRARNNKLTMDDYAGTTISLTNPGTVGTNHSMARLMSGQGAIIGVGAMDYPAEFQGMSESTLTDLAVSKIMTLTSTYDHRIIQGAYSGDFLRRLHALLLGEDGFYDQIFHALKIPYEPVRWMPDITRNQEGQISKGARIIELIDAYRTKGHLLADTDPLNYQQRTHPDLDIRSHGLTLWDLDREFPVGGFAGQEVMKLRDILGVLRDAYCRTVGVEYMHITDPEERAWIQQRIEGVSERMPVEWQKHILGRLNAAEAFETFLHTKFVGQKRFSLEGGETVIALLDAVLQRAAEHELDEVAIGMPHRGRLNVLANTVGKSYGQIFREFEGNIDPSTAHGSGDVKYHLGAEGEFTHPVTGHSTTVSLTSNPSHLETVDPVLEGIVRAKQDKINKGEQGFTVLPVLLHGDSAFAGQGVVAETLNLSQLRGYRTGGTVHIIVNNQVGFTTSPAAARSSLYCTDVARMVSAPIFHVNGDDPEACVRVARLAVEYRQAFKKDVVIDMVCYRRRGHNEGDDPSMTQPLMYDVIDAKRSVRKLYTEALVGRGDITMDEATEALQDYQKRLEQVFVETRESDPPTGQKPEMEQRDDSEVETGVSPEILKRIGDVHVSYPEGFSVHPKLQKLVERRANMVTQGGIDWGMGEILAFGSLLAQGVPVRLAGQDSRRGTFVQRHAVLIDRNDGEEYTPLLYLGKGQARFWVFDSLLSEYAAMGFEYGYSVENTEALVVWEAQFGDFANGAQSIIDEYITSGEAKWGQRSGVVLMLPHGHEGQGPDHSSARIERYLAMCAEDNMTVANCSTPANHFHILRRHALDNIHRPMVLFTPKSLLRAKAATSEVSDFTEGHFQHVIGDPGADPQKVTRVLLASGKINYELLAARDKAGKDNVAILRVEQLYPVPGSYIAEELAKYPNLQELVWVQEEPANMGAWSFMAMNLPAELPAGTPALQGVSRPASASPAVGFKKVHDRTQTELIERALG
ncbi:multifunctional oxoglutarate decarboxylase/oxoglutarate dehydrogenase thiamine pyrophosphate-binding subunit/dihydrolipoyllysine-residue succinyltransferase subunit [Cumulibacter manganitolerans]|uniref:multifunctional oxoglutarate decarboxylase/oxoglutarate dehydrogenase thiamine pyrophosphate-binding subunit/dihydrolipoyllysine-residue succinyltransferase subunit n=1 Tax=Cumulibacter manganitolerans TaxID=1884992 RepID=UPI001E54641A|nr:multifunctional oxoglutarate decarboxylase/oxoglutarate dehydrogenase thiamine pyrophosphate-binding subunit/dihydrolipoyllysine-residue succinyltransferase subunit [Cumulibacter manganitolerans]